MVKMKMKIRSEVPNDTQSPGWSAFTFSVLRLFSLSFNMIIKFMKGFMRRCVCVFLLCAKPSRVEPSWHATHSNLSLSVSRWLCAADTEQPPTAVMCENENWFWKQKGFLLCAATCRHRDNKNRWWRHTDVTIRVSMLKVESLNEAFFSRARVQCLREEMENHRHIFVARLWCRDKSNATQTSSSVSWHRLKMKFISEMKSKRILFSLSVLLFASSFVETIRL